MLSALPVRSTMIINVPGSSCGMLTWTNVSLHVWGHMYLCRCTYMHVHMVWKPKVASRCSSSIVLPLVYWGRVSLTWDFQFWLVCHGDSSSLPLLLRPQVGPHAHPPFYESSGVLSFCPGTLTALYAPSYLPSSKNTNSDELVFFPRN